MSSGATTFLTGRLTVIGQPPPPLPSAPAPKRQLQCARDAPKKNGVALALDVASLVVDGFGPEGQYAKLLVGMSLSSAATINSAAHQNATDIGLGMTSYFNATAELAARSGAWKSAKYIPHVGLALDAYGAYDDVSKAIRNYNSCMAH